MHQELRTWNPEIPESPERLDPVLRILLQLYSSQLSSIDKRIDFAWQVASDSLIRSLCPESMRWPVPAFTVQQCIPTDPVVEVDPHSRFFYKEQREGGQTFFFSALRKEKIVRADVKSIFLTAGDEIFDLSMSALKSSTQESKPQINLTSNVPYKMYIGIDYSGNTSSFIDALLFLKGVPDMARQLQWGYWFPGSHEGQFHEDCGFCPGLNNTIESLFTTDNHPLDWGGLRTSSNLFSPLINNFVSLPEAFVATWELGPPTEVISRYLSHHDIDPTGPESRLYWMRIDLPRGGDKSILQMPLELHFNCFIIVNKNELTLFKHTGGYRLVEIELPENISNILEITRVVDSNGREYKPSHEVGSRDLGSYTLEERENRLVLWFDYSSEIGLPPDAITVNYSITAGTDANGIAAGKVTELYESHPGIEECRNITPVNGAIPAKTSQQIIDEVSSRLRNRDRALSFQELSRWTVSFDPRIKRAECSNGVERAGRGIRRCIVIKTYLAGDKFYSDDETHLLQQRLKSFLKSRSPVNTQFKIEIVNE
jgi:hypothetical protein